ncbi:hypothetical protein NPX13_g7356 [Xylaria arbuscula]|uniref:Uncharacterized protein n=1 Tax=Xylaria arbuscula TaxID=114810 RepID=A0A9W8NAM8_9PEZI|nr:hypothetical protein NPX13_g7356 [Xylaria arbuscula]
MAQPRRHVVGGNAGGAQGYFVGAVLGACIDQPEGGDGVKSIQPIGLLFGPGSSESGRDISIPAEWHCPMAMGAGRRAHAWPGHAADTVASNFCAVILAFAVKRTRFIPCSEDIAMT